MIGKFQLLTDNDGDFLTAVDRDTFLTDVTLYWATGTIGSAMRIYRENRLAREEMVPTPHLETPVGYADFPKEVAVPPFSWITQTHNIYKKLACRRADTSRLWSSPISWLPIYGSSLQRLIRSRPNCTLIRNACETAWRSKSRFQAICPQEISECFCGCGLSCTSCRH